MPAYRDKASWYYGLSSYWFAVSYKWFILLLVVLPGQVKDIVPGGDKSSYWGMIFGIGAVWACIGPSIFGFLSDKAKTGFASRRLYVAIGAGLTLIALGFLADAKSILALTIGYLLLQVSDDVGTGPYSALIPELVPEEKRGRASGVMGILQAAGQIISAVVGLVLGNVMLIYIGIGVVNVLCAAWTIYTISGAEPIQQAESELTRKAEKASVSAFVRGWVEPWKHRDFFWAWFTRFLNALGFYLVQNYFSYYMSDRVAGPDGKAHAFSLAVSPSDATKYIGLTISLMAIFGSIFATKVSDNLGRKRVIYIGGTLMSVALIPFALLPNFALIWGLSVVFGIGYGMYLAADWALVCDVLPNKDSMGTDMGVWSMSVPVVQIFTGLTGWAITVLNNWQAGAGYTILYLLAAGAFFLGTVLVRKIQGST